MTLTQAGWGKPSKDPWVLLNGEVGELGVGADSISIANPRCQSVEIPIPDPGGVTFGAAIGTMKWSLYWGE